MCLILVFMVLAPGPVGACLARLLPDPRKLDDIPTIVIGRVLAVEGVDMGHFRPVDLTPPHHLTVEVLDVIKGEAGKTLHLPFVTGCAVPTPEPGAIGLFFLGSSGTASLRHPAVVPIYAFEGWIYEDWVARLKPELATAPAAD
jgi:hypothetical protein